MRKQITWTALALGFFIIASHVPPGFALLIPLLLLRVTEGEVGPIQLSESRLRRSVARLDISHFTKESK